MRSGKRLKLLFLLNLLAIGFLLGYRIYLNIFERDFQSIHARQVEAIQARLEDTDRYSFAVVGNINNSVGIFERRIIPVLNGTDIDFMVSAGNAVSSGGEDKYRALYRTLGNLDMPYLLTVGEHEVNNFGRFRFYKHFGPFFYSLEAGDSRFIFLDSTDEHAQEWQLRWLEEELQKAGGGPVFIFISHPLFQAGDDTLLDGGDSYLPDGDFRRSLLSLIDRYRVSAVFSANLHRYVNTQRSDTRFITTGGAGGLVLNNELSFYHFVRVTVDGDEVSVSMERLNIAQHQLFRTLESLWFFIHSLFYVGYLNFLLLICMLLLVCLKLYQAIFVDKDYYPDFDIDPAPYRAPRRRVAMFTNNYLPFIGGVPLSIARLQQGLRGLGHQVLVVAPYYREQAPDENDTLRVPSLLAFGDRREFRMANIFSPRTFRKLRQFRPEIVHLHHPFWMGALGLRIARRQHVPVVFTYHTRLEHYSHFVPLPSPLFRNLISHFLIRRFANRCDAVVVPTQSAEEYLRIIGVKSDIFVLPTGIEYERFQKADQEALQALRRRYALDDKRVFISVARLSKEKNIDFMLDAIYKLKQEQSRPFKLLMIGEGNHRDQLQERIVEMKLQGCVTLVGNVPPEEIPLYYQLGDAFLFASRSETQGMVLLEAMAAGLPVVAVRASGIDEVVRDGFNGFKTPENQGQWAEKVARLLNDDELLHTLGGNARRFAAEHDTRHFAEGMEEIYAQVLATYERRQRQ